MDEKILYLTFDDGPNEPYTSQILEALRQYEARATFFVCGQNAERDPDTVRQIISHGHALGNHAYSHAWWKTFSTSLLAEFEHTDQVIRKITGQAVKLVRPPWGLARQSVKKTLEARGFQIVHWDILANDWRQPPVSYMVQKIVREAAPGKIILLHDGDQTRIGKSRAHTVEAVSKLIPILKNQGYKFLALE